MLFIIVRYLRFLFRRTEQMIDDTIRAPLLLDDDSNAFPNGQSIPIHVLFKGESLIHTTVDCRCDVPLRFKTENRIFLISIFPLKKKLILSFGGKDCKEKRTEQKNFKKFSQDSSVFIPIQSAASRTGQEKSTQCIYIFLFELRAISYETVTKGWRYLNKK